jgi:hypothetical protein
VAEPIPKAYKPCIIVSLVVLVGSLVLLAADVVGAFLNFAEKSTPLWVIVIGVLALFGVVLGFGGLFLMLATAGWREWRAGRRVQVLPPR